MRDTHDNGGARRNGTRADSLREFTGDRVALSSLPGLAAAAAAYKLIISPKRAYYVRFGARVGGGDREIYDRGRLRVRAAGSDYRGNFIRRLFINTIPV